MDHIDLAEPRSVESKTCSPVLFRNNTGRNVDIIWLDFTGKPVSYGILNAQGSPLAVNTFVSHPWIAIDEESKKKLWLNSKEVFYPPRPDIVRVRVDNHIRQRKRRTNVLITVPVYNAEKLQDCCCRIISKMMKPADIEELPVPTFIIQDIKKYLENSAE